MEFGLFTVWGNYKVPTHTLTKIFYLSITVFFFLFRDAPTAYGSSQAEGHIGAAAARLYHSHSNNKSSTN